MNSSWRTHHCTTAIMVALALREAFRVTMEDEANGHGEDNNINNSETRGNFIDRT